MTDAIIQGFWYASAASVVVVALVGLAHQQLYEYRLRRRLDRRVRSLRRERK